MSTLKASKKDKLFNIAYSGGAAIVLIGAWLKITHYNIGPITGNLMLTVGLLTEAFIFAISTFDTPKPDYNWENVYPQLAGGNAIASKTEDVSGVDSMLSKKLDKMMEEAKLDSALISSLKNGIDKFKVSVDDFGSITSATSSSQKYSDQLSLAANHMESLNTLYTQQMEESQKLLNYNKKVFEQVKTSAERSEEFSKQMGDLTKNLADMNKVYGSMLSAMKS